MATIYVTIATTASLKDIYDHIPSLSLARVRNLNIVLAPDAGNGVGFVISFMV